MTHRGACAGRRGRAPNCRFATDLDDYAGWTLRRFSLLLSSVWKSAARRLANPMGGMGRQTRFIRPGARPPGVRRIFDLSEAIRARLRCDSL